MMLIDKIIWVLIFVTGTLALFSISTAVVQYADAESYHEAMMRNAYETINRNGGDVFQSFTHVDTWPAKEFYDSRMVHHHLMIDPEPLPMYRLDEIRKLKCDTWERIIGQIPFDHGVLMSLAISQAEPRHIIIANYGYSGFVGYLQIPCNEATLGMYDVQFLLWEHPTVKDTHFIEDPLRISMKVEVLH